MDVIPRRFEKNQPLDTFNIAKKTQKSNSRCSLQGRVNDVKRSNTFCRGRQKVLTSINIMLKQEGAS